MALDETRAMTIMRPQMNHTEEVCMVDQERWAEIRRLHEEERVSLSEIARRLDWGRKTVRRSLRQPTWQPYRRAAVAETRLTAHAEVVRARAPQVLARDHDGCRKPVVSVSGRDTFPFAVMHGSVSYPQHPPLKICRCR